MLSSGTWSFAAITSRNDHLAARSDLDHFGILAAYVDHHPGVRKEGVGAEAVARDLCNSPVSKRNRFTSVSRGYNALQIPAAQACPGQSLLQGLFSGSGAVRTGIDNAVPGDSSFIIEDNRISAERTYIHAGKIGHGH
jgi:hypothetical protein